MPYTVFPMRFIRKLFFFPIALLLVWLGVYTFNQMTDGFTVHQMTSSLPAYPKYEVALTPEKKQALQEILDQKFYYIGKGCQFYVFASEDDKYVIKFLKHKHLRPFTWLHTFPMPQKLRTICDAKIARRQERVERLFSSCKLAYEKMPHETGLLFIHLNRTPALGISLTVIDKMGWKHTLFVDEYEYVVQKKAISVKEVFALVDEQQIPKKIAQLIDLVSARYQKGISDKDRSFVQNVAFSQEEDRAVFIDIGQFYEDPGILDHEAQMQDLKKRIGNLRHWTERYFPAYVHFVDKINN